MSLSMIRRRCMRISFTESLVYVVESLIPSTPSHQVSVIAIYHRFYVVQQ